MRAPALYSKPIGASISLFLVCIVESTESPWDLDRAHPEGPVLPKPIGAILRASGGRSLYIETAAGAPDGLPAEIIKSLLPGIRACASGTQEPIRVPVSLQTRGTS